MLTSASQMGQAGAELCSAMMNSVDDDNISLQNLNTANTLKWYAALVKSCCERSTRDKLDCLGFDIETYVPTQKVLKIYCDRRKWVDFVVIPGFVFIGIKGEADKRLLELRKLPYIHRFLKAPGEKDYAAIPDHDFDRMRDFISRAEHEISLEPTRFTKGSVAHVYRGPFKGCEVTIIADDNESKAKIGIELEILGRTLCTTISKSDLLNEAEWRHASKALRHQP